MGQHQHQLQELKVQGKTRVGTSWPSTELGKSLVPALHRKKRQKEAKGPVTLPSALPRSHLHLPDVVQELRGGKAVLRTRELAAAILEEGQQVGLQFKKPVEETCEPWLPHEVGVREGSSTNYCTFSSLDSAGDPPSPYIPLHLASDLARY